MPSGALKLFLFAVGGGPEAASAKWQLLNKFPSFLPVAKSVAGQLVLPLECSADSSDSKVVNGEVKRDVCLDRCPEQDHCCIGLSCNGALVDAKQGDLRN